MITLHKVDQLRRQLSSWRLAGQRIALVPTMGNLHVGHLRLVERAKMLADRV
ncbi:MAG: pantoate--beta-alanine ligase, partial [Gammaproteobacteria bacterium]|nr:pantoate--beta-alanine ligase [Gammaproteobacteria bacterium]